MRLANDRLALHPHKSIERKRGQRRQTMSTAAVLAVSLLTLIPAGPRHLSAFEIGGCAAVIGASDPHCGSPVHEEITEAAIRAVLPNPQQLFINNVNHGVENTDLTHHFESQFHFDNSTVANGGFESGFQNVGTLVRWAMQEATVCDPTCRRNPQFLNPLHGTFTGIADDIVSTMGALATDIDCLREAACPTAMLSASAAAIGAEVVPTRADASPDPDRTYSKLIGDVKFKLSESLGRHCASGGRCFDRLEDMLTDRAAFQAKASHLRTLQQELQAYFAWQHLGHAFHAVQDFFAHSNYVELAAGKNGPPCSPTVFKTDLCDSEITTLAPDALPLPKAGSTASDVNSFLDEFSAAGVGRTLGSTRFARLESGFYTQPVVCIAPAGYHYCHYETSTTPGLNKDKPFQSGDANPSHKNHAYARSAATRLSTHLWAAFLHDLPSDHGASPVAVHSASPVTAPAPELILEVVYGAPNPKTHKPTVTVNARDKRTGAPQSGSVVILGTNKMPQSAGPTGASLSFVACREFDPEIKRYVDTAACTVRVTVTGYPVATTAAEP
jgi:hypothetical protein